MKKILTGILLISNLLLVACTGELPLSDLVNNSVTLKVMATYESNDPYGDLGLRKDDVIVAGPNIAGSNPPLNATALATYANTLTSASVKYYIDLAEIRLAQGQGKSSSQTISDYWSQFAIDRQLMCSDYGTADGRTLSNCSASNGVQRLTDFFNGGFTYPAVDVATGNYNHLGIYFRRFVTSPAAVYSGFNGFQEADATAQAAAITTFDNRSVYGLDIESFLQNPYGETAAEPLMFPLQRKDLSINISNGSEPYVLEVRMFLKNLMMTHVRQVTGDTATANSAFNSAIVYVGPSDWNANHVFLETDGSGNSARQGGALIMTARTYQPKYVGAIQFSLAGNSGEYFAVTDSSVLLTTPTAILPLAATRATNTTISNLQPGSYNVYRTCDKQICSTASTAGACDGVAGTDGYPETVSLCTGGPYPVSAGTVTNVTTTNCNASCP